MENKIQVFEYEQFGTVRTVIINGEPHFVAADVCTIFGVVNNRNVTSRLDEDEKGVQIVDTLGGSQSMTIVTEAGLYHMLFSMEPKNARSTDNVDINKRIERLHAFKRWITHEVLPQIRKTGGYIPVKPNDDYESVLKRNNEILEQTFVMMQQLKPKVELYDTFLASPTETSFKDYADTFGCGRNKLMNFLRDCNVLGKKNTDEGRVPFGRFVSNGCFIVRLTPCADGVFRRTTYITPKGINYIHKLCKKYHFNTEAA